MPFMTNKAYQLNLDLRTH